MAEAARRAFPVVRTSSHALRAENLCRRGPDRVEWTLPVTGCRKAISVPTAGAFGGFSLFCPCRYRMGQTHVPACAPGSGARQVGSGIPASHVFWGPSSFGAGLGTLLRGPCRPVQALREQGAWQGLTALQYQPPGVLSVAGGFDPGDRGVLPCLVIAWRRFLRPGQDRHRFRCRHAGESHAGLASAGGMRRLFRVLD